MTTRKDPSRDLSLHSFQNGRDDLPRDTILYRFYFIRELGQRLY